MTNEIYNNISLSIQGIMLFALVIAIIKYLHGRKISKADFLLKLNEMYFNDKEVIKVFNLLEWGEIKSVNDMRVNGIDLEKLFAIMEHTLLLKKLGLLTSDETTIYDYMIETLTKHNLVKEYFQNTLNIHIKNNKRLYYPYPLLYSNIKAN